MIQPWAKWCMKHNLKAVIYLVWLVALPAYLVVALLSAFKLAFYDASLDLTDIKFLTKDDCNEI